MRTDARIDKRQIYLPNTQGLGYCKQRARFGYIVVWRSGDNRTEIGRVAGRVNAPELGSGPDATPRIKDWLLVIALMTDMTCVGERQVNPADVILSYDPQNYGGKDVAALLHFMFGPQFTAYKPQDLRAWAATGWETIEQYLQNK